MSTTTTSLHTPRPTRALTLARLSVRSGIAFAVVLLVAGFVDQGYSHVSEGISALASDESDAAGLMTLGFLFLALTAITAGMALWTRPTGKRGKVASALVIVAGLITAADGFIRQSCSSLQQSCLDRESAGTVSGAHMLHNLSALALFLMLVIAGFLFASALKHSRVHHALATPTRVAACSSLALMVWFGSAAYGDFGGLVQRAFVLVAYGLPVVLAVRLGEEASR